MVGYFKYGERLQNVTVGDKEISMGKCKKDVILKFFLALTHLSLDSSVDNITDDTSNKILMG